MKKKVIMSSLTILSTVLISGYGIRIVNRIYKTLGLFLFFSPFLFFSYASEYLLIEKNGKIYKVKKNYISTFSTKNILIEPIYKIRKADIPNDPYIEDKNGNIFWWWKNIDAPLAWDKTTGSNTIYVAVFDTGVDYNHEDLKDNLWINKGELLYKDDNNNGIDDGCQDRIDNDGNGFVDDCYGINALCYEYDSKGDIVFNPNKAGCVKPYDALDSDVHGTHVTGIIGAVGNNNRGITGVNWKVKIIPCKFLDANGYGDIEGESICFDYINKLISKGLNIVAINASYGGEYFSNIEKEKIRNLGNILFITAAGNYGYNIENINFSPCGYDLKNEICVGASDENNNRAQFIHGFSSNYGKNMVKIFAPGNGILSTYKGNSYEIKMGTSQPTAFVTGAVALLKSYNGNLSLEEIKRRILFAGKNFPEKMSGYSYTCNILNLNNILSTSLDTEEKICLDKISYDFGSLEIGNTSTVVLYLRNTGLSDLHVNSVNSSSHIFRVDTNCLNKPLQTEEECIIEVSFVPQEEKKYQETISINYGNSKEINISLEGDGIVSNSKTDNNFGGCSFSGNSGNYPLINIFYLIILFLLMRIIRKYVDFQHKHF